MPPVLSPPNLLTILRLLLTPVVAFAIVRHTYAEALIVLAVAGMTDGIDGWLARRLGCSTQLGAYLDPVADKVLLVTSYVSLAAAGLVPAWLVALILGRDVLILLFAGAAMAFTRQRRFDPSLWGKLSTLVQIVTGAVVLAGHAAGSTSLRSWAEFLVVVTAILTVWSGLAYAWRALRLLRARSAPPQD